MKLTTKIDFMSVFNKYSSVASMALLNAMALIGLMDSDSAMQTAFFVLCLIITVPLVIASSIMTLWSREIFDALAGPARYSIKKSDGSFEVGTVINGVYVPNK